jgi:hypothetical protein
MARRARSTRRRAGIKLLDIVVTLVFLAVLILVVLPWAASSMSAGFVETLHATPAASH